jgi:hypothetical protein
MAKTSDRSREAIARCRLQRGTAVSGLPRKWPPARLRLASAHCREGAGLCRGRGIAGAVEQSRKALSLVRGPTVRISFPPAASQERTPPARSLAHSTFAELMSNGHLVQTGGRRWRRYETSAIASAYPRAPSTDIGWIAASLRSTGWFTASLSKGSIAFVVDGPFREFPESAG